MKVVTVVQMQQAERDCARFGISLDQLMENAGLAVAGEIRRILGKIDTRKILILVGPGNNGGDGLVAARHLHDWGASVIVYLCGKRPEKDPNQEMLKSRKIAWAAASDDDGLNFLRRNLEQSGAVVDSIFGTGQNRPLTGIYTEVLNFIAEYKKEHPSILLFAIDLPSGLNADNGQADQATLNIDHTIALGCPKVGLFNLAGQEKAGELTVADIGIPPQTLDQVKTEFMDDDWARTVLPGRPRFAHKGTFGKILAWVGSPNYIGAAYLACSGSIRVGAGLTTMAIPKSLIPILASKMAEVTYLPLPESEANNSAEILKTIQDNLPGHDVLLIGCGLGLSEPITNLVKILLLDSKSELPPLVLDADALNSLARTLEWQQKLATDAILTPHAAEMARLLNRPLEEIQSNRIGLTRDAAYQWRKTVVLKGANTVIASPDGEVRVSPFANPGLASAGTGDVLAGVIAGMAAQGLSLFNAACLGVYVHGLAGEMVRAELGDAGSLASDLLPSLPKAIRQLKQA